MISSYQENAENRDESILKDGKENTKIGAYSVGIYLYDHWTVFGTFP